MARRPKQELRIRRRDQVRALASPVRQALVNALRRLGRASMRELAHELGKPPATLYYHAEKLQKAGLLVEVARRETGRRPEALYELLAPVLRIDRERKDPAWRREVDRLVRLHLRELERSLSASLREDAAAGPDGLPPARISTQRARLSPTDLRELHRRMVAIHDFLEEATQRAGDADAVQLCMLAVSPALDATD